MRVSVVVEMTCDSFVLSSYATPQTCRISCCARACNRREADKRSKGNERLERLGLTFHKSRGEVPAGRTARAMCFLVAQCLEV